MTSELPDKGADLTWRNPNYEKDNLAFAARMLHISNLGLQAAAQQNLTVAPMLATATHITKAKT
jgi:hypothetical protein